MNKLVIIAGCIMVSGINMCAKGSEEYTRLQDDKYTSKSSSADSSEKKKPKIVNNKQAIKIKLELQQKDINDLSAEIDGNQYSQEKLIEKYNAFNKKHKDLMACCRLGENQMLDLGRTNLQLYKNNKESIKQINSKIHSSEKKPSGFANLSNSVTYQYQ